MNGFVPRRLTPVRHVDYPGLPGGDSADKPICVAVTGLYEDQAREGKLFRQTNAPIGADLLKPWCELYRYGLRHGIRFVTPDQLTSLDEADAVIFLDRPAPENMAANQLMVRPIPKYLVLFETEVIRPSNWDRQYHLLFDRIFTWNDDYVDNARYVKSVFPVEPQPAFDFDELKAAFDQRKLCTLIASGKLTQHPNELYSQRIRAIQWFETNAPEDFDLYGQNWPQGMFNSYRGAVDDKLLTLGQYRFSICFENASGYPGYITEKMLDCFLSGVVPVYWGAPNITRWIPEDCFIDFRRFDSFDALYGYLSGMDKATHGAYLDAISAFLHSTAAYPFSIDAFITCLTGNLVRDVKQRQGRQPRVSVAIPTYNHSRHIMTAIESALGQGVEDIEVLVADNASTDETPALFSDGRWGARVRYMRQNRNVGAALNWTAASLAASGSALVMLSSDDFFLEGHLRRALDALDAYPQAGLVYCPVICVDEADRPRRVLAHPGHMAVDYCGGRNERLDLLSMDCYITPSAAVIRRVAFDRAGGFRAGVRAAIDWDLWIRLAAHGSDFLFFRMPSVCYRVHGGQDTTRAVTSGDMLLDHVDILEFQIRRHGLESLAGRRLDIARLLQWRAVNQAGNASPQVLQRAQQLIQLLAAPQV